MAKAEIYLIKQVSGQRSSRKLTPLQGKLPPFMRAESIAAKLLKGRHGTECLKLLHLLPFLIAS